MSYEIKLLHELEMSCSDKQLNHASKYLNKQYNVFIPDNQLWTMIKNIFGEDFYDIFDKYSNYMIANKFINILLLKYYPCERTLKYYLANSFKGKNDIIAFEIPSINSRVDMCRFNTHSYAYEIKTEFDNFKRLEKQIKDYSMLFEYVYVVIPISYLSNLEKIIPYYCGIKTYIFDNKIKLTTYRKAILSPNINPAFQLNNLSTNDIKYIYDKHNITKKIPSSKEDRINFLLNKYSAKTINFDFKMTLKSAHLKKWAFIKENISDILPIDIQSFYKNTMSPSLIYMHE